MFSPENFGRLPPVEQDVLYLHQVLRKPQTDIAKILGVSQPTVNYRFKRAQARLTFLEQLPEITGDEVREVLQNLGARDVDIDAMVLYVETNSQSEVARRLNTSQGAVRYRVLRALTDHLQKDMREDPLYKRVRTACSMLISKPGIFNEPQKAGEEHRLTHNKRKLTTPPKLQGRFVVGEKIKIVDGLYSNLSGEIVEHTESHTMVNISLQSQDITLIWNA